MINITNKLARRLYLAEFIRQMTTLENAQSREFKPVLNRQYMNAAMFVQQGVIGTDGINPAVDRERDRLATLMTRHYRRVATVFGNKAFKIIESCKGVDVSEIKGPRDEFWAELNLWTRIQAGAKITKVQGTTKKLIAKVIRKGMQEGESHVEIAKRIRKTGRIATPHRARTIALTETHTAACKSVDAAIKSTRIEMDKEWLATMDKRTRPDHVTADGQRVDQDAKFRVGMVLMAYPGDPAGGADQVVRCRCTCLYHTVKRMETMKPYEPESELDGLISALQTEHKIKISDMIDYDNEKQKIGDLAILKLEMNRISQIVKLPKQHAVNIEIHERIYVKLNGNNVGGFYDHLNNKITMAFSKRIGNTHELNLGNFGIATDRYAIFRHEYGHHIFDELKISDQFKFHDITKKLGKNKISEISQYAATNAQEAFAESFAVYTSPKYKSGMLPKKLEKYFDKVLKGK